MTKPALGSSYFKKKVHIKSKPIFYEFKNIVLRTNILSDEIVVPHFFVRDLKSYKRFLTFMSIPLTFDRGGG